MFTEILACGLSNGMVAFWQYGTELTGRDNLQRLLQANSSCVNSSESLVGTGECVDAMEDYPNDAEHNSWPVGAQSSDRTEFERGPEYNWHPQPTAILTYRTEEEFSASLSETGRQVYLLSWDGTEERLAIAVSARQSQDSVMFDRGEF